MKVYVLGWAIVTTIIIGVVYGGVAFTSLKLNPFEWDALTRFFFYTTSVFVAMGVFSATRDVFNDDEK